MSRLGFLSGTTGTILLFAGFICAAAILPATLRDHCRTQASFKRTRFGAATGNRWRPSMRRSPRCGKRWQGQAPATCRLLFLSYRPRRLARKRISAISPITLIPKCRRTRTRRTWCCESLQDIPVGTPIDEIKLASDAFGLDFTFMKAVARIESDFDPKQRTGSYIGLFQLSNYEFARYGSGDITSPRDNAIAAAYKFASRGRAVRNRYPHQTDFVRPLFDPSARMAGRRRARQPSGTYRLAIDVRDRRRP